MIKKYMVTNLDDLLSSKIQAIEIDDATNETLLNTDKFSYFNSNHEAKVFLQRKLVKKRSDLISEAHELETLARLHFKKLASQDFYGARTNE